jgi:hypothetical protein
LLAHHHQAQPRPQACIGIGARRCEQPREVRAVELDSRKTIRLEVAAARLWIGSNNLPRVDRDDIGGAA